MRYGTQEELDAALQNAKKIPYGAVFKVIDNKNCCGFDIGRHVYRRADVDGDGDDSGSVKMWDINNNDYWWMSAIRLEVIK